MSKEIKAYTIDKPSEVAAMAVVLKSHIVKHHLFTNIAGKNYAHVEGWQFAGGMLGLFPRVVQVEDLSSQTKDNKKKWLAKVEIVERKTGQIVSTGMAICSSEEGKKKSFDEYAVLSMAQTRAIGKAYRNLLGWVMKLAGYESTPSEEIVSTDSSSPKDQSPVEGAAIDCQGKCGAVLSEAEAKYSMRFFGKKLCRDCQREAKKKTNGK